MDILLYQFPGACSRVTMNALEEIGVPYRIRTVNIRANDQRSPEYLAINPKGKVPAVAFDGRVMTENLAILFALHQLHPGVQLLPAVDESPARYMGLSDLAWCGSTLHLLVRQIRMPAKFSKGAPADVAADGMEKFANECVSISIRLADRPWWYGEQWSIVDVYIYWAYSTAAKGGFAMHDYPELVAHAVRVRDRPSFKRALAAERASVATARIDMPIDQL